MFRWHADIGDLPPEIADHPHPSSDWADILDASNWLPADAPVRLKLPSCHLSSTLGGPGKGWPDPVLQRQAEGKAGHAGQLLTRQRLSTQFRCSHMTARDVLAAERDSELTRLAGACGS